MPGCDLLVSTDAVVHAGISGGLWYLRLPTDPAFLFAPVQLQAFVLEHGANAAGVVTSNGLQLLIGP